MPPLHGHNPAVHCADNGACCRPAGSTCSCLQDPNSLKLTLPEGILITTRVLRRSEEQVADDRIETSEFMQQVFDDGSIGECLCAQVVRAAGEVSA